MEQCRICGKKFKNRGEVRSHIRLKHIDENKKIKKKWKAGEIKISELHKAVK